MSGLDLISFGALFGSLLTLWPLLFALEFVVSTVRCRCKVTGQEEISRKLER